MITRKTFDKGVWDADKGDYVPSEKYHIRVKPDGTGAYGVYFVKDEHQAQIDKSYNYNEAVSKGDTWGKLLDCKVNFQIWSQ